MLSIFSTPCTLERNDDSRQCRLWPGSIKYTVMAMNQSKGSNFVSNIPTELWLSIVLGVVVLVAWQLVPTSLGVPSYIIPTPLQCAAQMSVLYFQESLLRNIWSTLSIAILGFVIGSIFGAACGYILGLSRTAERVLSPYLLAIQIAPKIAFAPLFILWFGYNDMPKLLVTILLVFFPILVNALQSMRTIDRDLVNLARAYNMSRLQIFWKIEFRSSVPNLMAGLRIGATLAIIGVTVGEMVGGNTGLGYLVTYGEGQANTAMVFDAIILLSIIGILLYTAVAIIEARVLRYIPRVSY